MSDPIAVALEMTSWICLSGSFVGLLSCGLSGLVDRLQKWSDEE